MEPVKGVAMASAFRYSGQRHNDALLALGNIRIGTLHDFRRIEHKRGIADANEGTKSVSHHIPYATEKDAGSIHLEALKRFNLIDLGNSTDVVLRNIQMIQSFDHPDCFVHCVSADYSKGVLDQFEGADSCVEIADLEGFYQRLTSTLNSHVPVQLLAISMVQYMQRNEDWNGRDWGVHPALIKEPEFSKQVEIRAIWRPKFGGGISPVVINDIGLIEFCKARELPL